MNSLFALLTRVAPLLIIAAVLAGLLPLLVFVGGSGITFDFYVWRVLQFTVLQAGLSTILSVVPAIGVALALSRRTFWGRDVLLALFAIPLSLPAISAVLGITALYGSNGALGGWFNLYGLKGILIAHVFFNLPLATRMFLQSLNAIPDESYRLATQLDLRGLQHFKAVEWPALKSNLAAVSFLVFLLCAASFVIVLTLGGGPQATTLDVAIYQSLRLDFDVGRAISLALLQLSLCASLVFVAQKFAKLEPVSSPLRLSRKITKQPGALIDLALIAAASAVILPLLLMIIFAGLSDFTFDRLLARAAMTSLLIAFVSGFFTTALAYFLSRGSPLKSQLRYVGLIVPPAVFATGWFILFRYFSQSLWLTITLIVTLNILMALPFAVTLLSPAQLQFENSYGRLIKNLGLTAWQSFWRLEMTALRRIFLQSFLLSFAVSFGDLTAVTLLGSNGLLTLPSLLSQQLGNYRQAAAGTTALMLALIACGAGFAAQKLADKNA